MLDCRISLFTFTLSVELDVKKCQLLKPNPIHTSTCMSGHSHQRNMPERLCFHSLESQSSLPLRETQVLSAYASTV